MYTIAKLVSEADGLTAEEVKVIDKTRESIHSELYYICRKQAGGDMAAGAIRFGTICNLVHLAHKCARELAANFSLANVTNAFEIDTFLHSIHPHAW
uniref:Uncharacterized protein n=1 Tax=Ditylenchus dipsaci TaxID=166011 RepID=A0A915ERM8_9BILA